MTTTKSKEKFVTVNNLQLRYLDWGTEGKPPLVCLHGHTGHAHIWDEFAEAMSSYYHVYAVDQRGHGGSEWAADGYDRERFVEDLAALLDALDLSKAVLVGLSMGGWNSLLYTPDHQDRVERIIMVDIGPESSEASLARLRTGPPTPLEFDGFEEAFTWARQGNHWATDSRLRKDLSERMRRREDGKWVWKADPALFKGTLRDGHDQQLISRYWRSLEAVTCPILEVRGTGSDLVSDEILERMKKANPLLSVVDVEGAGHVVTVDKPQEFISATRDFLGVPS